MAGRVYDRQIRVLRKIYEYYDKLIGTYDQVCAKGCASCCTCNVTMTSLETACFLEKLDIEAEKALKKKIDPILSSKRFIPQMTTNQFARWCIEDAEIPEEENDPAWGRCPVLKENVCGFYNDRPFGCRALVSSHDCSTKGYAAVKPVVLAINQVFMQFIEHLDRHGISGNFSDMIALFLSGSLPEDLRVPAESGAEGSGFVPNEKIPVLMVEPAHRGSLQPVVEQLSSLCAL